MNLPLVTILTPVYNGESFLAGCIDSVRNQQYENWEYMIVDNCSSDSTLKIATHYKDIDSRITVLSNPTFVGVCENHNIAFRLVPKGSKYCKVVSADDWITTKCIQKLVELAETHPNVGIVGSYQQSGSEIKWKGMPVNVEVISGREVCRKSLLDNLDVFGTPTSSLYRSDLIRKTKNFFPHSFPHADTSACYEYLQYCDYGFVHEVLSIERVHDQQVSSAVRKLNMGVAASLDIFLKYGPLYLTENEFKTGKKACLEQYHKWLGGCVLKMREKEFWSFHTLRLRELGYPIAWRKVIIGAMNEIADEMQNPNVAFHKLLAVLKQKFWNWSDRR